MKIKTIYAAGALWLCFLMIAPSTFAQGFDTVSGSRWSVTAVRKVLQTFAYGGFATDTQIRKWAKMSPDKAIKEMLTFEVVNEQLSPIEDETFNYGGSLDDLQAFLSSDDPANPACPGERADFSITQAVSNEVVWNNRGLQNTWIAAVNKRGLNPFRQKVGLWLTNYHMAVSFRKTTSEPL